MAVIPAFPIGFGLMMGIPIGVGERAINLASWSFTLYYLAGAIVLWAVVLYLSCLLSKEKVVLSSKGDRIWSISTNCQNTLHLAKSKSIG